MCRIGNRNQQSTDVCSLMIGIIAPVFTVLILNFRISLARWQSSSVPLTGSFLHFILTSKRITLCSKDPLDKLTYSNSLSANAEVNPSLVIWHLFWNHMLTDSRTPNHTTLKKDLLFASDILRILCKGHCYTV